LNAYAAAERSTNDDAKFRKHRFGEVEQDNTQSTKRRRDDDEEEGEDDDQDGGAHKKAKRSTRQGDDDEEMGSDSSGNEWRLGGDIGEESDSDIDSDEAFGSSDEEKFEGFSFRGSKQVSKAKKGGKVKAGKSQDDTTDVDLNEQQSENEEDEDSFGEDGVDLVDMLDQPLSDEGEDSNRGSDDNSQDEEDEGDEADSEDADSNTSVSEGEDENNNAEKISRLQDLVASLEAKPRTTKDRDAHEGMQPSDFGVTASKKLKISDLLSSVKDANMRKSLKVLAANSSTSTKRDGIPGKLDAPLPKRQQDKLDRIAANEKAKAELDKWQDTVMHNRRAEHLSFPLADPHASEPMGATRMLNPQQQDKPQTDLEVAIQNILEESGLGTSRKTDEEAQIQESEELQLNKMPIEEVMERRAALRKARDLLFREEIKAKRIKKIKSKSYRRVHRKEKERNAERERALMGEDDEQDEDEKERQDRRRAEERMGLKHRESKWAKGMKKAGRTVWDEDARDGVVDMARRNEELRRRIEGKDDRDDDGSGASDATDDDEDDNMQSDFDDDSDADKQKLNRQLDRIHGSDDKVEKGIGAMAFMKRAEAARKAQNEQIIHQMRKELNDGDDQDEASEVDDSKTVGRMIFGPKPTTATKQPKTKEVKNVLDEVIDEDGDADHDVDIIIERANTSSDKPRSILKQSKPIMDNTKKSTKVTEVKVNHDNIDDWLTAKTDKKKSQKNKSESTFVPLPSSHAITSDSKVLLANDTSVIKAKPSHTNLDHDEDQQDSEEEAMNPVLTKAQEQAMFHARAFAGDDVDLAFNAEKQDQIVDEDDKYTSTHLPGWGSWTGSNLSKSVRKQNERQKHNPLFKNKVEGVRAADRRDAKLKNVIISEAQQRKGKKYLAGQLPHQYEKKEQYERALRLPVGPEWTTKEVFQRATKPRVVVKQGVIKPLERPLL